MAASPLPSPMGQAALDYARRGWPVFPCRPRPETIVVRTKDGPKDRLYKEKSPLVGKGGLNIASKDERVITEWWRRWPDAMIGLPIGEIGWFALDFDPRKEDIIDPETGEVTGVEEWTLERLKAETEAMIGCALPASLAVRTPSGGVHVYYQQPREGDLIRNRGNLPLHVDVRGRGGYVCLPPSVVIEGDNPGRYHWLHGRHDTAPVDPPQALIDVLRAPKAGPTKNVGGDQPPAASSAARAPATFSDDPAAIAVRKYALSALDDECRMLAAAPKGDRNTQINLRSFRLGQLVGAGAIQESVVRAAIQAIVLAMPHDGGDPSGALQTIENGLTAGMAQPRDLSDVAAKARERAERGSRRPPSRPPAAAAASAPSGPSAPGPSVDSEGGQPFRSEVGGRALRPRGAGEIDRRLGRFPMTDLGNAERFRERFASEFRWSVAFGWQGWDQRRWASLDQDEKSVPPVVLHAVFEMVRAIQNEADAIAASGIDPDDEQSAILRPMDVREGGLDRMVFKSNGKFDSLLSDKLRAWGRTSESNDKLKSVAVIARPWLTVRSSEFDADPMAVNCLNGTLRFSRETVDGKVKARWRFDPHDRADLISKLAPVVFDRDATCPLYDAMLEWAQPDPKMRRYLHQWGGLSMTADDSEQKLHYWYGRGRNGKGTTINAWCDALGEYTGTIGIESFMDQGVKRRGDQASPDMAKLVGVRLLRTSEPEQRSRLSTALIKLVTGGEPFPVRHLNRGFFDLRPDFKLTMSANYKADIPDTDEGIWGRLKLVPWLKNIDLEPPNPDGSPRKDKDLPKKIKLEASGVFNRLVDGLLDWLENGLVEPDAVKQATAAFREESDPLARFLKLCTRMSPDGRAQSSKLHAVFVAWCEAAGEIPWKQKAFSKAMSDKGFVKKASDGMQWLGIEMVREVSDFVDHEGNVIKFAAEDDAEAPPDRPPRTPPGDDDDDEDRFWVPT